MCMSPQVIMITKAINDYYFIFVVLFNLFHFVILFIILYYL